MNDSHRSLHDESDDALDRAIRAATAQTSPPDVRNRVIETAAIWQRKRPLAVDDQRRATHGVLAEEEKQALSGAGPVEQAVFEHQPPQPRVRTGLSHNHFLGEVRPIILAHKRLSLAAATIVTALAASLILYVSLFSSSTAVYALEQTAQANDLITTYHVKCNPPSSLAGISEAWVQLAPDGTPLHARTDLFGGAHGDRVGIVSKSRAEFWWKANNVRVVTDNKRLVEMALDQCTAMRAFFDPKFAFQQLQADKAAGRVQIAMKESPREGDLVTLTVTSKGDPGRRHVYEVDPKSKLLERVIEYRGSGGQWKQVWERNYLDYNKVIDPKVFQPELPNDITTVDPLKMDFGRIASAHRNLTNEQVATKLAREYLESLVVGRKLVELNDVRTATWKSTSVIEGPGHETQTSTGIEMFLTPSRERVERTVEGRKEIDIYDGQKAVMISLVPVAKMALVHSIKSQSFVGPCGNTFLNLRESIAHARRSTNGFVERLGVEVIDGHHAEGFRMRQGSSELKIWADSKTFLPVRVEKVASVGHDEVRTVMTDFHINVELDESLFRLDVPPGYTVQTTEMDFSRSPIAFLIDTLKFAAEHNDDVFPPTLLGAQGFPEILRRAITNAEKKFGKDSPVTFKLERDLALSRDGAFGMLSGLTPRNDWHYAGKGVKLYTPDKPIFWYKSMGADTYRVVFADLKIKELALEAFLRPFGPSARPLGDDQFEVSFSYHPGKKTKTVYLAGSFNDWRTTAHQMDGPDDEGRFNTQLKLKKGTYEYKFVLDDQTWETDPDNVWRTGPSRNSLLYIDAR